MSGQTPESPDDPFGDLPPELRAMLEQLGGAEGLAALQARLMSIMHGGAEGPVDWQLAERVALQLAEEGDREPTAEEERRASDAFQLAEHWLDASPLPASPDAGRVVTGSRRSWVAAAIPTLRPLVEPVAAAATDALVALAHDELEDLDELADLGPEAFEALPPGVGEVLGSLSGADLAGMLRPAASALTGLQAGQVVGKLSHQLLGQYDLGIPTAPRAQAHHLAVNVHEAFAGWELDPTEVALVLALTEAAHRRLYHALPWLEAHVASLIARFAAGTEIDAERMRELAEELMIGVDPEDPDSLRDAMERAATLRLEPTAAQHRVLERLQSVVCLVGAWARHEVARAVSGRLPSAPRIDEVLRRRRATRGDGEELLAGLLGLDLKPDDESQGERFVQAVEDALGPSGLHRALAHPENVPDAAELADPARWLERTSAQADVPDDVSELFAGLGEAPVEASADERTRERSDGGDENPDGEHPDDGDENPDGDGGQDEPGR